MSDFSPRRDRRAAILQSCYIPWKGYFDIIAMVDVFVVYDDVKYSKNHWHNRNLIKTQHGLKWLTVPVSRSHDGIDSIDSKRIARPFAHKHWRSVAQSYARAPFFRKYSERLEHCFKAAGELENLSAVNVLFLKNLCEELGIHTEIVSSRDLHAQGTPTERLVNICREVGAGVYLSGPSARSYIDQEEFAKSAIGVEWMDYSRYPRYSQLHGPFAHGVTILDLILNEGPDARTFLNFEARKPLGSRRNSSPVQIQDRKAEPRAASLRSLQASDRDGRDQNSSEPAAKPRSSSPDAAFAEPSVLRT